jgi:hypothetical protein
MNKEEILNNLHEIAIGLEDQDQTVAANTVSEVFVRIAKATMPDEMEGGHKSPPKGYPESKSKYADPVNFKYPIDTEAHARAAWAYIHQARNKKKYEAAEFDFICNRIKKALKKFEVEIEEAKK